MQKNKKEPKPIPSSQNSPTPREIYIRETKEQVLRDLGREINEENMAKVVINTKWEIM